MNIRRINYNHRIQRILLYLLAIFLHPFLKVKKGRVICFAYGGDQYSCNPRYISEYILNHELKQFDIYWLFQRKNVPAKIDGRIKIVIYRTIRAVIAINTAEFVITNKRTDPWQYAWVKKRGQKYIMTWHGGNPLKKIELDAIEVLGPAYLRKMKNDSSYCDLFLSGSRYTSDIYRKSFLYDGEILEKGLPRNDIFFTPSKHVEIKDKVFNHFGFNDDDKIVLYAPTFRKKMDLTCYSIDWGKIIPAFEDLLHGNVKVLIRLHPNFLGGNIDRTTIFNALNVYDATTYDDINDLIISSDVMITDYSSCMFDFAFMRRPIFIFATDVDEYDRGFYVNIRELPLHFSQNNEELLLNIKKFDNIKYQEELEYLMNVFFHGFDTGQATKCVVDWMISRGL